MTYLLHIRLHPLGVVVSNPFESLGELLLPGEECCGMGFDELARIAVTTREIEVAEAALKNCPLMRRCSMAT